MSIKYIKTMGISEKPKVIEFNNEKYYNAEDLQKYDEAYFKGVTRTRQIIQRKNIPSNKFIYAAQVKGKWYKKDDTYKRAKVLIKEKYVLKAVPKMKVDNNDSESESDKDEDEDDIEEKNENNEENLIQERPREIEFIEKDYFVSSEGIKYKIEMVGEREYDKCYFNF